MKWLTHSLSSPASYGALMGHVAPSTSNCLIYNQLKFIENLTAIIKNTSLRENMQTSDKKVKVLQAVNGTNSMTQLRSVTCHMGSHSVTCYPTQVNAPRLHPSQTG